ncbi:MULTISPECIES: flagellar basal body-associated protein FliL [unclassified Agarivorans]|uniref:flagellar basal body-associated protein FliL n=1 Tax=unclassified Agarivorans TaxID=2636026 RepID=UPI003D7D21DE
MKFSQALLITFSLLFSTVIKAEEAGNPSYAYFALEPDIITNYISTGKKLGYVRITADIMVENAGDLANIEHHAPLIRDAIIEILGHQAEEDVKSLTGREQIRQMCEEAVNDLLVQETGKKLVNKLLFTKYLYQ